MTITDPVDSLLLPIGATSLLVPMAEVSEIIAKLDITPLSGRTDWQPGYLLWRGQTLPIICYSALALQQPAQPLADNSYAAVIKRDWGEYAIACRQAPRIPGRLQSHGEDGHHARLHRRRRR